jgi:hypothetical protein
MKAIKLTPKERELFEALKSTPGGGTPATHQKVEHGLLSAAR